jgi:hypothetical protein
MAAQDIKIGATTAGGRCRPIQRSGHPDRVVGQGFQPCNQNHALCSATMWRGRQISMTALTIKEGEWL